MNALESEWALCIDPPNLTAGLQIEKEWLSVRDAVDVIVVLGEMLICITSEIPAN